MKVADVFSQDEMEDVTEDFATERCEQKVKVVGGSRDLGTRRMELAQRAAAALAGLRETATMRRGERRRAPCQAVASVRRGAALMGLPTSLMDIMELVS